jgi:hypothetical protein
MTGLGKRWRENLQKYMMKYGKPYYLVVEELDSQPE